VSQGKGEPRRETTSAPLLPLSPDPLLLHRQLQGSNRAPWQGEKDF